MDADDVKIITSQTGINDLDIIRRAYSECEENVEDTILSLIGIKSKKSTHKKTLTENIRMIFDEKDRMYKERKK